MVEINLFKSSPDAYDVEAGVALFTEGEPGDVMYAVIEGRIDVTLAGAATATATVTSRVARIDEKHFMFLVQEHPTFALQDGRDGRPPASRQRGPHRELAR